MSTSFETAYLMRVGTSVNFTVSPTTPNRYFMMTTVVGTKYTFATTGNNDLYAIAYDANRNVIAQDDDGNGNRNPKVEFTATTTRTYVMIRGYSTPTSTYSFAALLTEVPRIAGDGFDNAFTTLRNNGSVVKTFSASAGYIHFYRVTGLDTTKSYRVYTNSSLDLFARVYDVNENEIAWDDDSNGNSNPLVSFRGHSTVYIRISNYNDRNTNGSYTVFLESGAMRVRGVSVYPPSVSAYAKAKFKLTASVTPEEAEDKRVTWSSSNESVATVDSNGNVSALGTGSAVITVMTVDGGYTSDCVLFIKYNPFSGGSGTAEDPFLISSIEELKLIEQYPDLYFKQTRDLDLSSEGLWRPLFYRTSEELSNLGFQGSYDGDGFEIRNMRIKEERTATFSGLFACCDRATFQNIQIVNAKMEVITDGRATGRPENMDNGSIGGDTQEWYRFGGHGGFLVGFARSATIHRCSANGEIVYSDYATIGKEYNLRFEHPYFGALVGRASYVEMSESFGDINMSIVSCREQHAFYSGLMGGGSSDSKIRDSYVTGSIDATFYFGWDDYTIAHTYLQFFIDALCGTRLWDSTKITNCYTTVNINTTVHLEPRTNGRYPFKGIELYTTAFGYGKPDESIVSSYYLTGMKSEKLLYTVTTSGNSLEVVPIPLDSPTGVSQSSLRRQSTFANWDFENVWKIREGIEYPSLRWEKPKTDKTESSGQLACIKLSELNLVGSFTMLIKQFLRRVFNFRRGGGAARMLMD